MNDTLEKSLRELFVEDAQSFATADAVERLRGFDFRSRIGRRRRLWALVGASSAAITGGIVAAILLLSAGAPAAYAGWSSVPTTPTGSQIGAASASCQHVVSANHANHPGKLSMFSAQPVLAQSWDKYTAAVYVTDGWIYTCLYGDPGRFTTTYYELIGHVYVTPAPDQLSIAYEEADTGNSPFGLAGAGGGDTVGNAPQRPRSQETGLPDSRLGYGNWIFGQTGSDVSSVTFQFANHEAVVAAVQNGWYLAWWPWFSYPTSVRIMTTSEALTSPMTVLPSRAILHEDGTGSRLFKPVPDFLGIPIPACQVGASGCVFANTWPPPPAYQITRALKARATG